MCTVFAVYDVCKSSIADYPELSRRVIDRPSLKKPGFERRGTGEDICLDLGNTYWFMSGAESNSTVAANSILAREMLDRLQTWGSKGYITFPDAWVNFVAGNDGHAKGAKKFSIRWYQDKVDMESDVRNNYEYAFFYQTLD